MDKKNSVPIAVGATTLLVIFSSLCLVIFSLISLSTANAGKRLSVISAQSTVAYYKADIRAEEIICAVRSGNVPDGVNQNNGVYSFTSEISDILDLSVSFSVSENGDYEILKWQTVRTSEWKSDEGIDVWDGEN